MLLYCSVFTYSETQFISYFKKYFFTHSDIFKIIYVCRLTQAMFKNLVWPLKLTYSATQLIPTKLFV